MRQKRGSTVEKEYNSEISLKNEAFEHEPPPPKNSQNEDKCICSFKVRHITVGDILHWCCELPS